MKQGRLGRILLWSSLLVLIAGVVWAAVTTIPNSALIPSTQYYTDGLGGGIGSTVMAPNDDSSAGPINLGFTVNFFGTNYTQFFVNNNGNVTFGNGLSAYTPTGPQGATQPIISPYFADVDTRGAGQVYVRTDIPNEIIVTWDQVGYYSIHADKLASFQLVLRGPNYNVPAGEGTVGFFYKAVQWETGDASGGTGGFGGTPAAVGFGDGNSSGYVLAASLQNGVSSVVTNHHIWFSLVNGVPQVGGGGSPTPAPTSLYLLAVGLIGLAGYRFFMMRRNQN